MGTTDVNWKTAYALRPEHLYIGPKGSEQAEIVAELRANGYWGHEHTTETGEQLARIYSAQRKVYEKDPGGKNQPRVFLTDRAWWLYSARFYHVNPHLIAETAFPEDVLEKELPERGIDWLYRYGSDSRGRLLPKLVRAIAASDAGSDMMATRVEGAKYLEENYGELVPILAFCIPQLESFPPNALLRMPRASFETRMRSYRKRYSFPDALTVQSMVEYLVALGICEHTHNYYLRFAFPYAAGLLHLKNTLTHAAISARLSQKG